MLPPISSMEAMPPPQQQHANVSSMRHQYGDNAQQSRQASKHSGAKRSLPPSILASADSSDVEEDDGELPASGLVAPWEVLRGLADVAIQRAAKVADFRFCRRPVFLIHIAGEWRR